MMGYYGNGIGYGFGWIFMIIFWALIIWAIFALIRGFSGHNCCQHKDGHMPSGEKMQKGDDALSILKERYAKGEVSKEDFDRMKKDLE